MTRPDDFDFETLEARDRRTDRRERAVALVVLALLVVGGALALAFGGSAK